MQSMTGYGRGEATNGNVTVVVELKSVNNRFLDVQVRLPRPYSMVEPRFSKALKSALSRGRVEVFVRRQATESGHSIVPDPLLAERYLKAASEVAKRLARPDEAVSTSWILSQPGVLYTIEHEADAIGEWELIQTALDQAIAELISMRNTEGTALRDDLQAHLDQVHELQGEVAQEQEGIVGRLEARLQERLTRLVQDRVDPGRLAQEVALLADKADVSEELARIQSHCTQFAESLKGETPVGRKLEFLLQELNREVNTIGSKAAEHPVSARIVEMKSVLERMREQAANVE
jgi:uncharacterized protein (TIGR00255 family)